MVFVLMRNYFNDVAIMFLFTYFDMRKPALLTLTALPSLSLSLCLSLCIKW